MKEPSRWISRVTYFAEALNRSHEDARIATMAEIDSFEHNLKALDERRDVLTNLFVDRELSKDEWERQKQKLEGQRQAILDKLRQAQLRINGRMKENARTILELAMNAKSLWKERSPQERLEFLKLILSNPTWDGVSVGYELKKPFALLREMKRLEDWRAFLDEIRTLVLQRHAA